MFELLNQQVLVPQWYLVAIGLASALVSSVVFLLVDFMSYKWAKLRSSRLLKDSAVGIPEFGLSKLVTKVGRGVPLAQQRYWYYVTGVLGRFTTLREALSASGEKVPSDKMLDWKKLPANTRARIRRVEVSDKQPNEEAVVVTKAELSQEHKGKTEPLLDIHSKVVRPLSDGSYFTISRKKRKY